MRELSYNEIINIRNNISRKLISYINEYIEKDQSIDAIDFHYPDFDEDKTEKAFNSWISLDYRTDNNKTFITHMLEDKKASLSFLEREILEEVRKTYISLYEIKSIKNDYIEVYDLLNKSKHKLWDPKSVNIVKKNDLILARIGKIVDSKSFVGNLSFLPPSVKEDFIEEIYQDYGRMNMKNSYIDFRDYLKNYSLNLYRIYTDLVYELIKTDEEFASRIYDELDSFEAYMDHYLGQGEAREYVANLMNFFEYYLIENGLELEDIYDLDFKWLTKRAIEEGFINNKEDFISYLNSFKNYSKFLKSRDRKYLATYNKILEISQERFIYLDLISKVETPFHVDRKLSRGIYRNLSEKAFSTLMDYERFLLHILDSPLDVDSKNQIRREDLFEINEILDNSLEIKSSREDNFPMINLFYRFSLDKESLEIKNGFLRLTKRGNQFLRLNDEDKFSILFNYIWSRDFLLHIARKYKFSKEDKELFLQILTGLKNSDQHKLEKVMDSFESFPNIMEAHYRYLELIDIVECKDNLTISITPFGKLVLSLSKKEDNIKNIGKVININRKIK